MVGCSEKICTALVSIVVSIAKIVAAETSIEFRADASSIVVDLGSNVAECAANACLAIKTVATGSKGGAIGGGLVSSSLSVASVAVANVTIAGAATGSRSRSTAIASVSVAADATLSRLGIADVAVAGVTIAVACGTVAVSAGLLRPLVAVVALPLEGSGCLSSDGQCRAKFHHGFVFLITYNSRVGSFKKS